MKCWLDKEHTKTGVVTGFDAQEKTEFPYWWGEGSFSAYAEPYTEPEHKFFTSEQVLIRDSDTDPWEFNIFSRMINSKTYKYGCLAYAYAQCIPYAGNEHLLGTTNSPEA